MLVLTRKLGESIAIDDHIKIMVVQIKGKQVRLGIQAPPETKIHRQEVYETIQTSNKEAASASPKTVSQIADLMRRETSTSSAKDDVKKQ